MRTWDSATGTKGLAYETLFLYDPQTDKFTPWLAESGTWTDDKTYDLKLSAGRHLVRRQAASPPTTWSSPSSSAR